MKQIYYGMEESSSFFLKELLELKSQIIYSDRFIKQFGQSDIEASYFIISLGKDMGLKISSNWLECQETLDDYCFMVAEKVNFSVEENPSIFSFECQSTWLDISVLSKSFSDDDMTITSDFGILLERDDKKKVCFIGGESAFRNVVLIDDAKQIDKLINSDQVAVKPIL